MPAVIFKGADVQTLKDNIALGTSQHIKILSGDTDNPTSVAKSAPQGSLYFRSGTTEVYRKLDNGSSTNWELQVSVSIISSTDNAVPRFDGTGGDTLQQSGVTIDDSDNLAGLNNVDQSGYTDLAEIAVPSAPGADTMRIYAKDNNGITVLDSRDSADFSTRLARDSYVIVRNTSGSTITKGTPVYVTGATGSTENVAPAQADATSTLPAIGLVAEEITNNSFGRVRTSGTLDSIDTSSFSEGDELYISAASAGALTATKPTHPNLVQKIGVVTVSDVSSGEIEVFRDAIEGKDSGTNENSFKIGDGTAGTKSLDFVNANTLNLQANPTAGRTVSLPDNDSTLIGNAGSSTDNAVPRFDGATGHLLQTSGVSIQDDGRLTLGADGSGSLDAITKQQLDAAISGVDVKEGVKAASTADLTLSGEQTVDGISLVTGDRILVKDQSTATENGIYTVDSGAWSRSDDANSADELNGALVTVDQGTSNANTGWYQSEELTTLGSDNVSFSQFFGAGTYVADGDGIELSGSTFSLELDGSTLSKSASGLRVAAGGITNTEIDAAAAIAYSKLSLTNSIVNADISSSAAIAYSKLNLTDSIVNADINSSAAIAYSKLAALTADRALLSNGSGFVSPSAVTATELGYVSGVTSAIQTQIDGKEEIYTIADVSSNITLTEHRRHLVDTSASRTLTLPGSPSAGDILAVKDVTGSADANNITIARAASESIEGVAGDYTIDSPYASVYLVADSNGDWWII